LPGVPHLQNPNRTSAAHAALAINPCQVLILDDAFQHRRLARDLDVVLLDALEPFGYERLLPRGLLREPIASLARAQVVALSRSDAVDEFRRRGIEATVRQHAPQAVWMELVHRPRKLVSASGAALELDALSRQPVAAFCGIGNPAGFRHTLASCGLKISGWLELPDHCTYGEREMTRVLRWISSLDVEHVVCTRKDLVKIPRDELAGRRLWALEIELEIVRGRDELERMLEQLVPLPA
jgi:tetraacyldisaccharide 4'-kinase